MNDHTHAAPVADNGPWVDRFMADQTPHTAAQPKLINLATVRGFIWRQRLILVGITAAALLLGFILTLLATPIYEATAAVRVDPDQTDIFEGESLTPNVSVSGLDSYLATVGAVVQSHSFAAQVAASLSPGQIDRLIASVTEGQSEDPAHQSIAQRREAAADVLQGNISTDVPGQQRLIQLSFRSSDPKLAMEVANAYANNLLTDDLRRSLQKNSYAQAYLQKEIASLRGKLDDAQRRALGYARANGIIGDSLLPSPETDNASSAPETVTATRLAAINAQLSAARARRIATEQNWRSLSGTAATDMPAFIQSNAGQGLLTQRSQIETQLAELRQRYGPEHPEVREAQAQLGAVNRQIGQLGGNFKASLRKTYEVAAREEAALQQELNRVSGDTLDEQDRRVAFNQLNSESVALQTQLDALLTRYNQIAASANVTPSTMTLLDAASTPGGPVSPNLLNNLLIALVLGGGLALGLAVLRETLDDRLRSEEDVETKLGLPLLGVTPLVDKSDEIAESSALSEAHSSIRAALDFALAKPDHNVVLLTSSQSVEGKTTTAVAIAREYARLGRKVLLIDADLRRPSVSGRFGFKRNAKGFAEVLAGDAQLEEALLDSPAPGLDVLPVGAIPSNPVEIVSSSRVDEFFDHYREVYNLIVVDCPPIIGLADAPLLSRVADGVVFVVESNRAHFGQAKTALRRLRDADANMLGVVLTKFRALDAGYNYSYQYSYYTYGEGSKK